MRFKATVEKKGVGTYRRQRQNGSDWGGHEMRQKASGLIPFLSPWLVSHSIPLGMLGTEVPAESPVLRVTVSFPLEAWCCCLAEQVGSRGATGYRSSHTPGTEQCPWDALEKAELLHLGFSIWSTSR